MPAKPFRRTHRVTRYPSRNRILNIGRLAQWNRLHRRGKNQLVFVMFTLDYLRNGHRLRTTLAELSNHNEFHNVLFAVVDIEKASAIAEQEEVADAPTFVVYKSGNVVERLELVATEVAPANIWQMLHRNVVNDRVESANQNGALRRVPRWRRLAVPVLSVLAIAAGTLALFFVEKDEDSTKKKTPNSKIQTSKPSSSKKTRSKRRKHESSDESSDEEF